MKYWIKIFLLFSLVSVGQVIKNKDSLIAEIESQNGDEKAFSLLELAKFYQYVEPDSICFQYAIQAHDVAQTKRTKGIASYRKGLIYRTWGDDINQLKYYTIAVNELLGVDDSIAADAIYYKSRVYQRKGMYPEALKVGLQELALRKKLPSKEKLINAYQEIGFTYDRMGDYFKAIEWHKKSLDEAITLGNPVIIGRSYGLIGIAYDELKDFDKALEYNFKAVEYFKKDDREGYLRTWYSNIGNTYTKKGDLKNAEKYTLLALDESSGNTRYVTRVNLGKIYLEQGKFNLAETTLQSVLNDLIKADDKRILSEAYYRLHELRKKQGNFKEALLYFEKYKTNEDEMLNEAKLKQINEMSIQYETIEKEKALAQEKVKVAERELKIKSKNNLLLISGFTILSILLLSWMFLSRQKFKNTQLQKEKELSEALLKIETNHRLQEQRLAISRDLHDNIGSQLTFIISSIDSLKMYMTNTEAKVDKKLTSISQFTRATIQELRDTIWAMNKEEISVEDLKSRISNFIEQAQTSLHGINFDFKCKVSKDFTFNSKDGINIYRIIQEALNNAIKHANATEILVEVKQNKQNFEITIKDNGKGFDATTSNDGNGLKTMKNRANELNATINFISNSDGTSVVLNFDK